MPLLKTCLSFLTSGARPILIAALVLPLLVAAPASARDRVPNPTVTGPISNDVGTRGRPKNQSILPLTSNGYIEEEYFLSGTARDFQSWSNGAQKPRFLTAQYTTRMLVRRPLDRARFNGSIIVDWFNVTGQEDSSFDWPNVYDLVMRDGYVFVSMSAQKVGVDNLKVWDAVRYADLNHPGDNYSFDIYAQAVQALRSPSGLAPLADLKVQYAFASGLSQSGTRLRTFVNIAQNHTRVLDGFLIRGQNNPVFGDDLSVPVIVYMSEFEISNRLPSDSPFLKLWHVAGSAHGNTYGYDHYQARLQHDHTGEGSFDPQTSGDYGQEGGIHLPLRAIPPPDPASVTAGCANSTENPERYIVSMAVWQLNRWAREGIPAIQPPLATLNASGQIQRDQYGNMMGGMRLPPLDVPVANYTGNACTLIGSTVAFDVLTLNTLYPTHEIYVDLMQQATDAALAAEYMLPEDAVDLMTRAQASDIPPPLPVRR